MNIGKSTKVGQARRDISNTELAKLLGISKVSITTLRRNKNARSDRIEELAEIFGVTASEFISWGE